MLFLPFSLFLSVSEPAFPVATFSIVAYDRITETLGLPCNLNYSLSVQLSLGQKQALEQLQRNLGQTPHAVRRA